ncbi:hypothetical protein [Ferrovibrio sp.]|uniref:hypothetical protein n=1 Tax=Ferrovibrio sp. TaxID=1917215 RepID=UPI00311D4116
MVRALDRLKQAADPTSQITAFHGRLEAGQGVPQPAAPPVNPKAPTAAVVPAASPPAAIAPVADHSPEPPASQRTSVLLTGVELDILDRMRGMRLPNRVRLNDSDIIRAAMQHLNTLTDAQIAEILSRTAPLRRGRK